MSNQWQVGQPVDWLFEARGGYGYRYWVNAKIVRIGKKKITIDADLADGGTKRISVNPDKLRAKESP